MEYLGPYISKLDRRASILVTGSTGMVGSAVYSLLTQQSYQCILAPTRQELDLLDEAMVQQYFAKHRPTYVFLIAGEVGGIAANRADPLGFLSRNIRMELNLFDACQRSGVRKALFVGSSCIYPRECPQPMKESFLLTGPLEPTNEGYSLAKIVGLKFAEYYFKQYGFLTVCAMPCNIYGTNDHFDLKRSHVLAALVKRFVDAQEEGRPSITLWGTGSARREFIHVDDVASALLLLMDRQISPEIINVGTGQDISIHDLAMCIAENVGFTGKIFWDSSCPDGMPRKCLDVSKLTAIGFKARVPLDKGIERTITEYRQCRSICKDEIHAQ